MTKELKYNLKKRENEKEVEKIIRKGIKKSKSGNEILNELKSKGFGYKRKDFYHDKRKIQAEYIPKKVKLVSGEVKQKFVLPLTPESKRKKEKWFKEVFEPFRVENKLTSKQASKIIRQETITSHKSIRDMRTGKKYYDKYKKVF